MRPILTTFTVRDGGGDLAAFRVYLNRREDDDLDAIDARLLVLWDSIRPLINGVLVAVDWSISTDVSAWENNTVSAIADKEELAVFKFVSNAGFYQLVTIPTILEDVLENAGAGKNVNRVDSRVVVFIHTVTNDEDEDGADLTDNHGNILTTYVEGYQKFRR